MEPRAHFQQRSNPAANLRPARGRARDARQNLQQRRLAGAVPPDQAKYFPFPYFQRYVLQRPKHLSLFSAKGSERRPHEIFERMAQAVVHLQPAPVLLAESLSVYDRSCHIQLARSDFSAATK